MYKRQVIKSVEELEAKKVFDPEMVCFVFDHSAPSPNMGVSSLHKLMRNFVDKYNIKKMEIGEGVCHIPVSYTHLTLPTIYSV